ncbi:MAG: PssD/Cps14F family polysaccharide biosynthesis glycosyltransferase [Prochloraceae cyanobacterium]
MKILLVCSTGGHFRALQNLDLFWKQHEHFWITFYTEGTEIALKNERVYWAYSPTNRNILNLMRNLYLAWKIIRQEKPQMILSTGAGVAVPFIIVGKIYKCKTVFVESYTRVKELSLSAKLVLPFLDILYVQWRQLKEKYPQAQLIEILTVK